jgi:hypothetical protein
MGTDGGRRSKISKRLLKKVEMEIYIPAETLARLETKKNADPPLPKPIAQPGMPEGQVEELLRCNHLEIR